MKNLSDLKPKAGYRMYFKMIFILILMLLLMIPNGLLRGLIQERNQLKTHAIQEISKTWGQDQTISGPFLVVPFVSNYINTEGKEYSETHHLHITPTTLNLVASQDHQIRKRSIYEAILYETDMLLEGSFDLNYDLPGYSLDKLLLNEAAINIGISGPRSISEISDFKIDDKEFELMPGTLNTATIVNGIHGLIPIDRDLKRFNFSCRIKIKGSSSIAFEPIAKNTSIELSSTYPSPSFNGAALPVSHDISKDGFKANWETTQFSRNYPNTWVDKQVVLSHSQNTLGVKLLNTVDHYQKNMRTIKYALLIIGLTFFTFFFFENLFHKKVHPIQYIMIGMALSVFYLLLIAISEHLNFDLGYWISAAGTIGVVLIYSSAILKQSKSIFILGALLFLLYSYIFVILQLEEYALLAGSLGLFFILACIMIFSRKFDWYSMHQKE